MIPKQTSPYYIYAPCYTDKSSGVRALHLLAHSLNERGQKAFILPLSGHTVNPYLNTPFLTGGVENYYKDSGIEPILVYPDIVQGNPHRSKKVVRYLLAPPGEFGGQSSFGRIDKVYSFSKWTADQVGNSSILRVPVVDTNIFHSPADGSLRSGSCFYSHKYDKIHGNALLDITAGAARLEGSLNDIACILRQSEVCYLYEISEVMVEAQLCGCPVVFVRTPYFNETKWSEGCPMQGVRWNDEERTLYQYWASDVAAQYNEEEGQFQKQLSAFIEDTQNWKV